MRHVTMYSLRFAMCWMSLKYVSVLRHVLCDNALIICWNACVCDVLHLVLRVNVQAYTRWLDRTCRIPDRCWSLLMMLASLNARSDIPLFLRKLQAVLFMAAFLVRNRIHSFIYYIITLHVLTSGGWGGPQAIGRAVPFLSFT